MFGEEPLLSQSEGQGGARTTMVDAGTRHQPDNNTGKAALLAQARATFGGLSDANAIKAAIAALEDDSDDDEKPSNGDDYDNTVRDKNFTSLHGIRRPTQLKSWTGEQLFPFQLAIGPASSSPFFLNYPPESCTTPQRGGRQIRVR